MHVFTWISLVFTQVLLFVCYLCLSSISTSTLFLYVELVSRKLFLTTRLLKIVLTCLICFISTILGTNSLNCAHVQSSKKLTNKQTTYIQILTILASIWRVGEDTLVNICLFPYAFIKFYPTYHTTREWKTLSFYWNPCLGVLTDSKPGHQGFVYVVLYPRMASGMHRQVTWT